MNIKIPKKRAKKIMEEEVEKFLDENKDFDRKRLEQFIENNTKEKQK
jgi:dephospho-CoA kinase